MSARTSLISPPYARIGTGVEIVSSIAGLVDTDIMDSQIEHFDNETGLLYYGYRHYNSQIGRWVSRDPAEEDGGVNLYAGMLNNLFNLYDPTGLITIEDATMTDAIKNDAIVRNDVYLLVMVMIRQRNAECPPGETGTITKEFKDNKKESFAYMWRTPYPFLGGVGVELNGSGTYEVMCCPAKLGMWQIDVNGSFFDRFDELIPRKNKRWIGGLPITFVGSWTEEFSGN